MYPVNHRLTLPPSTATDWWHAQSRSVTRALLSSWSSGVDLSARAGVNAAIRLAVDAPGRADPVGDLLRPIHVVSSGAWQHVRFWDLGRCPTEVSGWRRSTCGGLRFRVVVVAVRWSGEGDADPVPAGAIAVTDRHRRRVGSRFGGRRCVGRVCNELLCQAASFRQPVAGPLRDRCGPSRVAVRSPASEGFSAPVADRCDVAGAYLDPGLVWASLNFIAPVGVCFRCGGGVG